MEKIYSHTPLMAVEKQRPEWAPANAGDVFASEVRKGRVPATTPADAIPRPKRRRNSLNPRELARLVREQDRTALARAITMVESRNAEHEEMAAQLLQHLREEPVPEASFRLGITGVPGAGKSTLIENFGLHLCNSGLRVAILAIDPSSARTGGSILGDKTRMEELSREPNAFIRPSPSGGTLGGVARRTRETMVLCEAAGFDVILVETVGVGQSEGMVRDMVDCFLLVLIAGAGDELQGIKRGVMELADIILVNKCDGDNVARARTTRADLQRVLHYLRPSTEGWQSSAHCCSALTGEGISDLWELLQRFRETTTSSGVFQKRRQQQNVAWMERMLEEELRRRFFADPGMRARLEEVRAAVAEGRSNPTAAVRDILRTWNP